MAREETTFDEVAAAAARLQKEGQSVTVDAVRAALGDASAGAVYRHLAAWRAKNEKPAEPPKAELPKALAADLAKWARQYADEAAAPARAAQAQLDADIEALRIAGEGLEAELAERDETIERLNAELRNARQVAMDALVSKAKDQLAIDGKENQLTALRAEVERHMAAQAAESDARLQAEMELVGATTARDSFATEAKELRAQLDAARSERGKLRAELEALKGKK